MRMIFAITVFVVAAAACGQATVSVVFPAFVDDASNNSTTTMTLGQSITWTNVSAFGHTVTSGTGPLDPATGVLFNASLLGMGATFTFTPTSAGVIDYYCMPHFAFGMTGQIIVLPAPTAAYPGTGDDLTMDTAVNSNVFTSGPGNDIKTAVVADIVVIRSQSPNAAYNGFPLLLVAEAFPTGSPPTGALPGIHVDALATIVIGFGTGPFGPTVLVPGGVIVGFIVPLGLTGISAIFQPIVLAAASLNGIYAAGDAHEFQIL